MSSFPVPSSSSLAAAAPGGVPFLLPPLLPLPLPPAPSSSSSSSFSSDLSSAYHIPRQDARLFVASTVSHVLTNSLHHPAAASALGAYNHQFQGQHHPPQISLLDYSERLIRYVDTWAGEAQSTRSTGVSCCLVALVYLSRAQASSWVTLTEQTVHRLFLTAMLCAVKFTEDFRITNRFWAKVGGIDLDEMNRLEVDFLRVVQWKLRVDEDEFAQRQRAWGW